MKRLVILHFFFSGIDEQRAGCLANKFRWAYLGKRIFCFGPAYIYICIAITSLYS